MENGLSFIINYQKIGISIFNVEKFEILKKKIQINQGLCITRVKKLKNSSNIKISKTLRKKRNPL